MAIEDIFRALEQQADQEIAEMLDAAREQAAGIEEDGEAQGASIRQDKIDGARHQVAGRVARVINAARLDARRGIAGVREKAIEDAYGQALGRLDALRSQSDYPALFRALAEEAIAGIEGEVTVLVDPADAQLAAKVMADLGVAATVDATTSTRGGLTLLADGDTMVRRNTIEDRIEKYRAVGESAVAEALSA
jgi:vacuolar-type H+-ATPase subunit E/Vma4